MAIVVATEEPEALLEAIYDAIDDGTIETWCYDEERDFFHCTSGGQWSGKAWLEPEIDSHNKKLRFTIIPPQGGVISEEVYAVYHGRFIEMLLAHFDDRFARASATAQLTQKEQDRLDNQST